jgi:hypothetical protein
LERFSDSIKSALENFATFEARQAELLAELEVSREAYRKTNGDKSKSKAAREVSRENLQTAEKAYSTAISAARGEALAAMDQTRTELAAAVKTFLKVKPQETDNNAMALLSSGMLTADDLTGLAGQFGNNATMLRVIAGAAQRLDDSRAQGLALQILGFLDPDARTAKLDGFIAQIRQGLTANPLYTSAIHTAMAEGVGARFAGDMEKMEVFTPAD